MTDDYYEDSHGNKIIGPHNKSKFVFSGFNSFVRIGENVNLHNSNFYIHNDVEVDIGDGCKISNNCKWIVNSAHIDIGNKCRIYNSEWKFYPQSYVKLGDNGKFLKGKMVLMDYGQIIIGRDFRIMINYHLCADMYTQITIGDDVLCSHNVIMRASDGHSIFDVHTGMNINSTEEINKNRKVVIGNHVWISANAIILYNSEICNGSIIGAGSLVKGKIPNNCIAAGVPARVIRKDIAWSRKNCADQLMENERVYARLTER